jgi:hypothetical protein
MLVDVPRFTGGIKWMGAFAVIGVVGLVVIALGLLGEGTRAQAYHAYLAAFAYWFAVAACGLLLLLVLHTAGARWPTVIRRPIEGVVGTLPIFVLLFIPIGLGLGVLYPWVNPEQSFDAVQLHHFHHKAPYFNLTFFWVRQALYAVVIVGVGTLMLSWSNRLDEVGGHDLIRKKRRVSAGAIPFVALALTWASFDWLMTLTPLWQSTMYGVYYFAGGFLSAIAVVTLATVLTRNDRALFGWWATRHHHHNLGKLLLAFTAFWAYIGFSQFMLVWVANLPEEVPYYWVRLKTDWRPVSQFLMIFHFAVPFALLLSRTVKLIPNYLAVLSVYTLVVGMVDVWWLVMPKLHPEGPVFSLYDLAAFVGVGGVAVAFGIFRLRGRYMIPVRDPYLEDSLRYVQP